MGKYKHIILTMAVWLACTPALADPKLYNQPANNAGGAKTADQTCDPKFWQSMSARAWMEAEREIIQNKNLIYKPDSVMEYVCFDSFMQHGAMTLGPIFTHTTYFTPKPIIPGEPNESLSTAQAFKRVITDRYAEYIKSNFGHKFLGGRAEHLNMIDDREIGSAATLASYTCNVMARVWRDTENNKDGGAQCENFIDNKEFERDGFFPFERITGDATVDGYKDMDDPRKFPGAACKGPKAWQDSQGNQVGSWSFAIQDATNKNAKTSNDVDHLYKFKEPNKKTYDDIRPLLKPGECSDPIQTGVTVKVRTSEDGYPDAVCSNPGCSYQTQGSGSAAGQCKKS